MSINEMLEHNREHVRVRPPRELPAQPRRGLAVVTCMDARIDFVNALGLVPGEAHIIRNAGGRIADAARSLVVSQALLGTREVAIVHHTRCGMLGLRDEDVRAALRPELGADVSEMAFLGFGELEQSVRDDIALYREQAVLQQGIPVRGFIYDVDTAELREVDPVSTTGRKLDGQRAAGL